MDMSGDHDIWFGSYGLMVDGTIWMKATVYGKIEGPKLGILLFMSLVHEYSIKSYFISKCWISKRDTCSWRQLVGFDVMGHKYNGIYVGRWPLLLCSHHFKIIIHYFPYFDHQCIYVPCSHVRTEGIVTWVVGIRPQNTTAFVWTGIPEQTVRLQVSSKAQGGHLYSIQLVHHPRYTEFQKAALSEDFVLVKNEGHPWSGYEKGSPQTS